MAPAAVTLAADGLRVCDWATAIAGVPDDLGFGPPDPDAAKVRAGDYLTRHWSVIYQYDFGDDWHHTVELQRVVPLEEKFAQR